MPQFLITAPNGKKYRITGESPEGAMQALQQHLGGSASPAKEQPSSGAPAAPVDMASVYADEMLFGLPGKAAAGVGALIRAPFTDKSIGEEYSGLRDAYQNAREQYAEEHPARNVTASLAGGILGAGKFLKGGKLAADAVAPAVVKKLEKNIVGRAAGEAAGGAAIGGLSGYGHDQSVAEGALIGGALGGAARPVVEGATGAANAIAGMLGVGNQGRAQRAIYEALTRSGKSIDDVASDLGAAARDGQPEYMLADSLGNSGQRMLSGVARSPGDMRQTIAETLQRRQGDQGRRIANALQDASGSRLTAEQNQTLLRQARSEAAAKNYAPVAKDPTAIDVSRPVQEANRRISPAAESLATARGDLPTDIASRAQIEGAERSLRDPIREALRTARSYLASDKLTASNVNKAFRAKTNIDQMIATATERGQGGMVEQLIPVRDALDDALAKTSKQYAAARDAYKAQSGLIDAVDAGRNAGKGRQLSEDVLNQFGVIPEAQRAPFRSGYFDPLIRKAETSAFGADKSRPLITDAYARELPTIAAPGKGNQLMNRLSREQRMFETRNAALGGSKTADNQADIGEIAAFDPTMVGHLATGNLKGAVVHALTRGAQALNGRNQQTRDMIAKMLLQGSPTKVKADLATAIESGEKLTEKQATIVRLLIGATAPRLAAN